MTGTDWASVRREYFDELAPPDVRAAARMVGGLVAGGASVRAVVQELLRPAQIEVGRRWQMNEWSVADEHAASAVTEAALMAAAALVPDMTGANEGLVVLACAAGEWHTLPLRMVSEVLTEAGFECVFLGASVPPAHLGNYLASARPLALAMNASSALSLEGARACVEAAHSVGVPVVVGGRGFGADDHRAAMIGADAWTDDPEAAVDILASWAAHPPTALAVPPGLRDEPPPTEPELLIVRQAVEAALRREFPAVNAYSEEHWARTHEDTDSIVQFGVIAVRYDDDRIFSEFAAWLRDVLSVRHVPPTVFHMSLRVIADALEGGRPEVSACVRRAAGGDVVHADVRTV